MYVYVCIYIYIYTYTYICDPSGVGGCGHRGCRLLAFLFDAAGGIGSHVRCSRDNAIHIYIYIYAIYIYMI